MTTNEKINELQKKYECDFCNYGCLGICDACTEIVDFVEKKLIENLEECFIEFSEMFLSEKNITNLTQMRNIMNDSIRRIKGVINY